jgi:hypothetical protein
MLIISGFVLFAVTDDAQAAVTTGVTSDLVSVGQYIRENSTAVCVIGFNGTSSGSDKLDWVNITFINVFGFTITDLRSLSTDSSISGVGIYRDDGSVDDKLDSTDTPLTLSSNFWFGTRACMRAQDNVPANVNGMYQWLVVIRTRSSINNLDKFRTQVQANAIKYDDGASQPGTLLWGNFLTCQRSNVSQLLSADYIVGDPAAPVNSALPLGFRINDGGDYDVLSKMTLSFYDVGAANFDITTDLQTLSTDSTVSGLGLYVDDFNGVADQIEPSDTAVTFKTITLNGSSRVDVEFYTTGANKVALPDSPTGGNADLIWVLRPSTGMSEGDDFKFGIEDDSIYLFGAAAESAKPIISNTTSFMMTGDVNAPVVTGSQISIFSNIPNHFWEADTDNLNDDDEVFFNSVSGEGNGQVVTIMFSGYTENNPDKLEGETAFNQVVTGPVDNTDSTTQVIGYTIWQSGTVNNPLTMTMTDKVGHQTYYNCSFHRDDTDPQVDTVSWFESSDYIWVDSSTDTLYFRDGMVGTEYAYLSGTSSDPGTNASGLDYLTFSNEPSLASSPSGQDNTPQSFVGTYGVTFPSTATSSPAEVLIYDMVGNTGGVQMTYSEDNVNPTVSIIDPSVNGQVVSGVYQVNVSLSDARPEGVKISFNGGTNWYDMSYTGTNYVYYWDTFTYTDGSYNILVKGLDRVGNFAYDTIQAKVENFPLTVDFLSPSHLDIVKGNLNVVVEPSVYTTQCSLYLDVVLVGTSTTKNALGNYEFFLNTPSYSDGYHSLKAVVKGVGSDTQERQITIFIDNTPPVISGMNVDFPFEQIAAQSGNKVSIRAWIYENETSIVNITCRANTIGGGIYEEMYDDGLHNDGSSYDDYYGTNKIIVNATWAYHTVWINVTDEAGNTNEATYNVPVDSHTPIVTEIVGVFPWVQTACKNGDDIRIKATISEATAPVDAVLVLDDSGSMGSGPGSAKEAMLEAAWEFINSTREMDRIALYTFSNQNPIQVQPFIRQNTTGRATTVANLNLIAGMASGTPIWDTIGEALDYCIANATGIPMLIAMTDGADDAWTGLPFEEGSDVYCPWTNWDTRKYYTFHVGKYEDYGSGVPTWYNTTLNQNRWGVLNAPIPVFTIGLGLEHHDPPNKPYRFGIPTSGTVDYNNASIIGTEYGTPEFNLWRIADTSSGGKYYYAPDKSKLEEIYLSIADIVGDYEAPSGVVKATCDISGLSSQGSLTMFDDGLHEDGVAGDAVFATDKFRVQNLETELITVSVYAEDIAGNKITKDGQVMLDNVNPLVSQFDIHYPEDRGFVFDYEEVFFSVNASDEDTLILFAYVNATTIGGDDALILYNDGQGNDDNSSDTIYTTPNSTVVTGMETFAYKVVTFFIFDSAGNTVIQKVNLKVINDESTPVCNLISPIANESMSGNYLFQVKAQDESGILDVQIELINNVTLVKTLLTLSYNPDSDYYEYQSATHLMPDGPYHVTGIATDNALKIKRSATVDAYIDNNAPLLYINSPKQGEYLSGTVTFDVNAVDNNLKVVEYRLDGSSAFPIATPLDTTKELDGLHTVTIQALDFGGHITSKDIQVYIDNEAPTGFFKAPMVDEYIDGVYDIEGVITDAVGISTVKLSMKYEGHDVIDNATTSYVKEDEVYKYILNTVAYDDGAYELELWALDGSGKQSRIGPMDMHINNDPPELTLVEPLNNSRISGNQYIINAHTSDPEVMAIKYKLGSDNWKHLSIPINTTTFQDGPYPLSISAFDKGGKSTQYDLNIYVDNNKPTCLILNPSPNEVIKGVFTFEVKVYDLGGVKTLTFDIDGVTYNPLYNSETGTYKWTMNVDHFNHSLHKITATAVDHTGAQGIGGPVSFIVDYLDTDEDGVTDDEDDYPLDPDEQYDSDDDGLPDGQEEDDDNDGVLDEDDAFPRDPDESIDSDHDGIGDNTDTDDDNDGIPDHKDEMPTDPRDSYDNDGDGIGDSIDPDDDNDGVPDEIDAFPLNPSGAVDTDGDGMPDELLNTTGMGWFDEADRLTEDLDDDNDGVLDVKDEMPTDPSDWRDTDGDGVGDHHDKDDDGDGVPDTDDFFPKNKDWDLSFLPTMFLVLGIILLILVLLFVFVYRENIVDYTFATLLAPREDYDEDEFADLDDRPRTKLKKRRRGGRGQRERKPKRGGRSPESRRDSGRNRGTSSSVRRGGDDDFWDQEGGGSRRKKKTAERSRRKERPRRGIPRGRRYDDDDYED